MGTTLTEEDLLLLLLLMWYNNKYHIKNSSNNKSPLPRGLQSLPRFLSHTEQLLWYFLWIDLSNIRFRFDVVEEKEGT